MKRILLTVALATALTHGVSAARALAGSGAGAIALSFPVGARYNALGEAGTALSQDVTAHVVESRRPGLPAAPRRAARRAHHAVQPRRGPGRRHRPVLGRLRHAAGRERRSRLQPDLPRHGRAGGRPTRTATRPAPSRPYMFAFGATYGVKLTPNLGVGLGVKYFRDNLADGQRPAGRHGGGSGDELRRRRRRALEGARPAARTSAWPWRTSARTSRTWTPTRPTRCRAS